MSITSEKAKELVELVQQAEIPTVFEQLKELGTNTPELYALEREFIFGKYTFEFYDRLQVYINSLTSINIEVKQPKYDIFISSSHLNQTEVEDIAYTLREQNLSVFFFDESTEEFSKNHFTEKVHTVLKNSTHFLLYCTPEAVQSKWVEKECESFFQENHSAAPHQRKIFILKGKNFHPNLIPTLLHNIEPSENINKILLALGKKNPEESLQHRKEEYTELTKAFYADGLIAQRERNILRKNQLSLHLTDEQVAQIEEDCQKAIQQAKKMDNYTATSSVNVQVAYADDSSKKSKEMSVGFKMSKPLLFISGGIMVIVLFLFVFSGSPSKMSVKKTNEEYQVQEDSDISTKETSEGEEQSPEVQEDWLKMPKSEEKAIDDIVSFMNVINLQRIEKANGKENYEILYINTFAEYLKRLQVEYPNLNIADPKWHRLIEERIDAYEIPHKDFEALALKLLEDGRFEYIADFENWFSE